MRNRLKSPRYLSPAEQWAQAARCACRGADDYCPCQNVPDRVTAQLWAAEEIAKVLVQTEARHEP